MKMKLILQIEQNKSRTLLKETCILDWKTNLQKSLEGLSVIINWNFPFYPMLVDFFSLFA